MSEPKQTEAISQPPETPSGSTEGRVSKLRRWTTHQIFVLFAPADNDEWVKWSDIEAASLPPEAPAGPAALLTKWQAVAEALRISAGDAYEAGEYYRLQVCITELQAFVNKG